ncbi:MAG: HD domain-containing protein, partial [Bacteroidales bacterium]|nr:HD domain-containing protein [Bacteroidales bacterium]
MTREEIYLAALLHDIGKFWQRADDAYDKSKNLSKNTLNIIDYIAPKTQKGYPTHQHVIWTYELLDRLSKKNEFINKNVIELASYHHRPISKDGAIIQMADWWARGLESIYEETEEKNDYGTERYKKIPLGNVFSLIQPENSAV